ncbi:hypothetical protein FKM82_030227 [Ascaphus truei]
MQSPGGIGHLLKVSFVFFYYFVSTHFFFLALYVHFLHLYESPLDTSSYSSKHNQAALSLPHACNGAESTRMSHLVTLLLLFLNHVRHLIKRQ